MATVLVPWRGGCPHRERAWGWVAERWSATGFEVRLCKAPPGPWCKAAAIREGAMYSASGPVVIADADCWTDGILDAVAAVECGAPWAVPHLQIRRLTEKATGYLLNGCSHPIALDCGEDPYNGIPGGGIVAVHRDVLLEVPFDPRFRGWGGEDTSWRDAMLTLIGSPRRGREPLYHLWHPPQPRMHRKIGTPENHRLRTRYVRANRRPRAMRALLDEIEWEGVPRA